MITVTGHTYRFGTDSYTTYPVSVKRVDNEAIEFTRPSGKFVGSVLYMEPTNEHAYPDMARWYVHVVPAKHGHPWGFYVSQEDMWKLDRIQTYVAHHFGEYCTCEECAGEERSA